MLSHRQRRSAVNKSETGRRSQNENIFFVNYIFATPFLRETQIQLEEHQDVYQRQARLSRCILQVREHA